MTVIDPLTPMGYTLSFNNESSSSFHVLNESELSSPDQVNIFRKFKKDLYIQDFVERLKGAYLYYIEYEEGKGDELYYFRCQNKWFHGEPEFSNYHPFLPYLADIKPSASISDPSFFLGTRNNYTHQMVDFFPNLLISNYLNDVNTTHKVVVGTPNSIFDELIHQYIHTHNDASIANRFLWLSKCGKPTKLGPWSVRCLYFSDLILVRHLSIFHAFRLLRQWFSANNHVDFFAPRYKSLPKICYIRREDDRVNNDFEILSSLQRDFDVKCVQNIHLCSFQAKLNLMSKFSHIIIPPGSDSINAAIFSNSTAHLIQLSGTSFDNMFSNPFYSFASLRYFLPFMDRMSLLAPFSNTSLHSGSWSYAEIHRILSKRS